MSITQDGIDTGQFDKILRDPQIRSLIYEIYKHKRKETARRLAKEQQEEVKRKEHDLAVRGPIGAPGDPTLKRSHNQQVRSHNQEVRSCDLEVKSRDQEVRSRDQEVRVHIIRR